MNTNNDMNDFEQKLGSLQGVSLSHEEKEEMRQNIRAFIAEHPVRASFFARYFSSRNANTTPAFMRPALAGLMIVFVVGSGTSLVAADALPGDFLYPYKIHVTENVEKALALSAEAKINQSAALAVRRIEEAENLAAQGRLTAEAKAEIEARFNMHVEQFSVKTAAVHDDEDEVEVIADAQSDLEASLRAHAAVLSDLSLAVADADGHVSEIARFVSDRVRSVEMARVATEERISGKVGEGIRTAVAAKRRAVERELSGNRTPAPEAAPAADSAVMMMSAKAVMSAPAPTTTADTVEEALHEGAARIDEGQYGEAFKTLQGAVRAIKQEKLELDVRERLNLDVHVDTSVSVEADSENIEVIPGVLGN